MVSIWFQWWHNNPEDHKRILRKSSSPKMYTLIHIFPTLKQLNHMKYFQQQKNWKFLLWVV